MFFFTGAVHLSAAGRPDKERKIDMTERKNFQECLQLNSIPEHDCKQNLEVIEKTHSVNSLHNIIIARKLKCKICNKIFEQFDPRGLDKLY